ncbi:DNA polymerase beta [Phytophthora citrophthora]|uniref:DNA polymerase n=1 Tax=Phytophthora citrophthora TaxID=4793 RepID=A0AAD9GIP9_9STRA|nr:DNA polymerase beta [Phytophthora citrophthora]
MHPQSKRKFFADLALLLDENPPEIRPLKCAFFGPELPEDATASLPSSESQTQPMPTLSETQTQPMPLRLSDTFSETQPMPSGDFNSETQPMPSSDSYSETQMMPMPSGDSFDSVDFGIPRIRSSGGSSLGASQQHNDSMADSLFFLPQNLVSNSTSQKRQDPCVRFEFDVGTEVGASNTSAVKRTPLPVTTLVNCGIVSEKPPVTVRLELADYYDTDRMCELTPCWLRSDRASCEIHQTPIQRPMLLFCIQALDEYISRIEWLGQQRWRMEACKVARRVFTAMWEAHVLDAASSGRDVVLTEYLSKKLVLPGVGIDAWRIIARYWDKYKQNYLHQQELYFSDALGCGATQTSSRWDSVRALLHIYGMKPSQALRLVEQQGVDQIDSCELTEKQLRSVAHGLPSIEHLQVGIEYLASSKKNSAAIARRPMISQQDGKTAFHAILIHLTKWKEDVQVFPCGSFSRGAAFISVLDVLVAVPSPRNNSRSLKPDGKMFDEVVAALTSANVIQNGMIRRVSCTRGVCILSFKNSSILLDLKVCSLPRSWFALLYFTGPENFAINFFTELLQRSMRELPDTSFECVYASVAEALGQEALLEIASEKDLFDLVDREYVRPTDRI